MIRCDIYKENGKPKMKISNDILRIILPFLQACLQNLPLIFFSKFFLTTEGTKCYVDLSVYDKNSTSSVTGLLSFIQILYLHQIPVKIQQILRTLYTLGVIHLKTLPIYLTKNYGKFVWNFMLSSCY
jgi:hypothetical protein